MSAKFVELTTGKGGLPLVKVRTPWSTAEIYLHGAHVTHFQKNGEPPLLFMSAKSHFAPGQPIRGGVPVCFPWFGNRDGEAVARFCAHHRMAVGQNRRRAGRGGDAAFRAAENSRTRRLGKICGRNLS